MVQRPAPLQRVENIYLDAGQVPNRSSHDVRMAAIFRGVRWRTHDVQIYRAGDLHNKPGKPGIFNVGRTHFYDVIEPRPRESLPWRSRRRLHRSQRRARPGRDDSRAIWAS
jgi:hypothetical protein